MSPSSYYSSTPNRATPCEDEVGPGWTKFCVPRKSGGRADVYYLSPPGPNQVKKNSLKQAVLYHQQQQRLAAAAGAGEETASSAGAGKETGTDDESPTSVKRSTSKQSFIFNDSDSDSDSNSESDVKRGNYMAVKGDSDPNDSDDSSVDVLLYSSHPPNLKGPVNFELACNRHTKEFLQKNGLTELTPYVVDDIFDSLVKILNVTDPDNKSYATSGRLIKFLKKEMKKKTSKTASQSALSVCQKHAMNEMLDACAGGKVHGLRSVRFHVNLMQAISKLLNKSIMVVSPPLHGKSSVGLLSIKPERFHDFQFHDGPDYFPELAGLDEDADFGSDSDDEIPVSKSVADKQLIDEQALIVRAVIDFHTNKLLGFKAIIKDVGDDDDGLSNTDSDEDDDSVKIVIPTASLKPRSRDGDPFATPQPKKQKSDSVLSAPPLINPYKMQLQQGKFLSSFTAVGEHGNHVSGGDTNNISESCTQWGSSPEVLEQLNKKLTCGVTQNSRRGGLVLELTHGITDTVSGKKVYLAIVSNANEKLWWFKAEPTLNPSFALFFSAKGPKPLDAPASCYTSWVDSSIRARPYGENKVLRRGRVVNGQLPYPRKYPVCEFETIPSGFPIDVVTKQFESYFRSMASDGSVMAAYFLNHLEESGSSLLNMFLDGKFRNGKSKNTPYKDTNELKQQLKQDIEDTFKNGFARIEYSNYFDKYFCDFTIQQFLMKLGYHAWDELNENERKLIYKNNLFPVWDEISEEPDRAS